VAGIIYPMLMRTTKIFFLLAVFLTTVWPNLSLGEGVEDYRKVDYAECLEIIKLAALIKSGSKAGKEAEFLTFFEYSSLGRVTVYVSALNNGPKAGHAIADMVVAIDDDSFILKTRCTPQGSYQEREFNSSIFAKKIEDLHKRENDGSTANLVDRFASILKNLEKGLRSSVPPTEQQVDRFASLLESLEKVRRSLVPPTEQQVAMIDIVKRTMEPCWIVRAGNKEAENIDIEIEATLTPEGYVKDARLVNRNRLQADAFSLAAGESALRAVLNPSCQPYKLPADKYEIWKDLKLTFSPKEMLGR
jgi:hypothetical protein